MVCFLNDEMPDIHVLRHFRGVIYQEFKLSKVRICVHSLQFALEEVEFDLLFAKNMVTRNSRGGEFSLLFIFILSSEINVIVENVHYSKIWKKLRL